MASSNLCSFPCTCLSGRNLALTACADPIRVGSAGLAKHPGRKEACLEMDPSSIFSLTPGDFFTTSPFELMRRFTGDMDRLFEVGPQGIGWNQSMSTWSLPIEVKKTDGQLNICAELPGFHKEDFRVGLTPEDLVISGQPKREHEEKRNGNADRSVATAHSSASSQFPMRPSLTRQRPPLTTAC
jgi:HSP20 family molecular chaperone IbpA